MIRSMTAYGRGEAENGAHRITVELRSLNGRYLDLNLRVPKNYMELEESIRKLLSQNLRRGRVEVHVQIEPLHPQDRAPSINISLARYYWKQLHDLHLAMPGSEQPSLDLLLRLPNLFEASEATVDKDSLKSLLQEALSSALDKLVEMRDAEGIALQQDLSERLETLNTELQQVAQQKSLMLTAYQDRLRARIQELLAGMAQAEIDEARLLQEVALFAERSDINEEIVRLESHFEQMQNLLAAPEPTEGRQLDFLTQELHREVNTIGSKANDLKIAQIVVRMKSEIGKLREQVQNVE